jgi:hypothetical protein
MHLKTCMPLLKLGIMLLENKGQTRSLSRYKILTIHSHTVNNRNYFSAQMCSATPEHPSVEYFLQQARDIGATGEPVIWRLAFELSIRSMPFLDPLDGGRTHQEKFLKQARDLGITDELTVVKTAYALSDRDYRRVMACKKLDLMDDELKSKQDLLQLRERQSLATERFITLLRKENLYKDAQLLTKDSESSAVFNNRVILESGINMYFETKGIPRLKSMPDRFIHFRDNYLLDAPGGNLTSQCRGWLESLNEYGLSADEHDVRMVLDDIWSAMSSSIPKQLQLSKPGFYIGGSQPLACALALVMLKLQELDLSGFILNVLDQHGVPKCILLFGRKILPVSL